MCRFEESVAILRSKPAAQRLAIIVIYLLANLAYLAVLSVDEMRRSTLVAADVAERVLGAPGVKFVGAKPNATDKLTRWQQYAQILLASNELMYVD